MQKTAFKNGFSLIEMLLFVVIAGFLIFLISAIPNSVNLVGKAKNLSLAKEIVSKQVEEMRSIGYSNLADGTSSITDSRINLLPSGNGSKFVEICDISVCVSEELVKKVTVKVNWKDYGKDYEVKVVTLVSEGGLN